jgi:flagellar hook-associated protein 2
MTETSIAAALGVGSGIDTRSLVAGLVQAQFGPKSQALTLRKETLTAQISALSQLRSGLTGFSTALTNLISGGSLSTQPVSADPSVLKAALLPGAHIAGLSATIEVQKLAASQVVTSGAVADKAAPVGKGTITITLGEVAYTNDVPTGLTPKAGATPVMVTIGDDRNSLQGVADAINAASAGVTATVITDATGSRLSVKGQTGIEQGFTIDVAEDAGAPGLAAFAYNTGSQPMTLTRKSDDAVVALDGVAVRRASNSISDLVTGVKLDLVKAAPGQVIALTSVPPTEGLSQAVRDIVDTFNELMNAARVETDRTSGVLKSDAGAKEMMRQLGTLTGINLYPAAKEGEPATLAQLGVKTNRDGTLTVDAAELQAALVKAPVAVEEMLTVGLKTALRDMSTALTSQSGALAASQAGYTRLQSAIEKEELKIESGTATLTERLTRQFASMDARVSAYKATMSFMDQQIKNWTKSA